jgi:predicted deacylase
MPSSFEIAGESVAPGSRALIDIPVARLSNHTPVTLPVHVIHGRRAGPTLFISAAIHGDEILGVEIIRRLLNAKGLDNLKGTLLCIPIVNAFGFLAQTRYLPDRRDLNRVFPGSRNGSLAGQLAYLFLKEIVGRSDFGIDVHTGAINRANLPQIRADFMNDELKAHAEAFAAPVVLQSPIRPGSLREAADSRGVGMLLYEAGEALRLDELAVRLGVRGIQNVMHSLGMLSVRFAKKPNAAPVFAKTSSWARAPDGGLFRAFKTLGDSVAAGDIIGFVTNPYEGVDTEVNAPISGVIIGRINISVVNRADALFHIAEVRKPGAAETRIGTISSELENDRGMDEEEIA